MFSFVFSVFWLSLLFVSLGLLIYLVLKLKTQWLLCEKMQRKEKLLYQQGVDPYGSSVSHGMCIEKRTGKLVPDQKKSQIWYESLID